MNTQPEALQIADGLEREYKPLHVTPYKAAAELRRLHAENEALKAELQEQARINGMGAERELALMAKVEALKADAKAAYAQGQRDMREAAEESVTDLFAEMENPSARHRIDYPRPAYWRTEMKEIDKLCLTASGIFFAKTEDAAQAQVDKLRTALEQALAAKPVGYWLVGTTVVEFDQQDYHSGPEWEPIYTAPPARVDRKQRQ